MNFRRIFLRGDTHGDFDWLSDWCEENKTSFEDALIILGDAGIMYYGQGEKHEENLKKFIFSCPITILCVRGNHEARPADYKNIQFDLWEDDPIVPSGVWYESEYPNIKYFADGSTFTMNGKRFLVIGGAFSIDKEYRLLMKYRWFSNEELAEEEMCDILDKVDHQKYDYVLTHTCPIEWEPKDLFLSGFDQSKVSKRMELFLSDVKKYIEFDHWYFGHYHNDRILDNGRAKMLFTQIEEIKL